ncbi:MAG: alpha/beta fold hydrolase [Bacteroidota bacterium]
MGRMNYIDEGSGAPIVMCHGNPGWSFEYRNVVKEMAKTNRCIVPDYLGFGFSDKPYNWDYKPESHAKNFELFINSLKLDKFTLVVNDWGGPIGLSYALKYPEKIKKIFVLNSFFWSVKGIPHMEDFSRKLGSEIGRFMVLNFNVFGRIVAKQVAGKKFTKNAHKHYYKHMTSRKDRKGSWVFPREIIGSSDWLASLWEKRRNFDGIPKIMLWGMEDPAFTQNELDVWINEYNDVRVVRLDGVGHFPQEEEPESVVRELRAEGI